MTQSEADLGLGDPCSGTGRRQTILRDGAP